MMKFSNKIFLLKSFFLILFIIVLFFLAYLNFSLNKKIYDDSNSFFTINSGESVSKTLSNLKSKDVIDSEIRLKIILYLYDIKPSFINGKYVISEYETEYSLLKKFLNGDSIQDSIIIYEGMTHNQIIKSLKDSNLVIYNDSVDYTTKIFKSKIKYLSPEGTCFPDTYKFSAGIFLDKFIENCSKKMERMVMKYWKNRDYSLPYKSPYEMLIMASIIEKETSVDSEKSIISSVFINRLNKNMRLQADPTVIYGMKNYKGNITKKDLKENNEYNTYRIKGLPKTPICSPGEVSIKAASKPDTSDYLYFVANKKGKHVFSKNYKDHVNAVNKYQK